MQTGYRATSHALTLTVCTARQHQDVENANTDPDDLPCSYMRCTYLDLFTFPLRLEGEMGSVFSVILFVGLGGKMHLRKHT